METDVGFLITVSIHGLHLHERSTLQPVHTYRPPHHTSLSSTHRNPPVDECLEVGDIDAVKEEEIVGNRREIWSAIINCLSAPLSSDHYIPAVRQPMCDLAVARSGADITAFLPHTHDG